MPKKSKSSKKASKKPVKKPKKYVVTKKATRRENPNKSVRRIPAKVGATSRATITEVVAPTGARGGKDSYKKRSKEQIQAEKIAKAEALLGLQQRQPSTRKVFANVKPPDITKYGGYTGLTSGYGLNTSNMDEKLKNMEQRILNQVKKQNNPAAANKKDVATRTDAIITEVSSRKITPPKQPSPALVASQLRARQRHKPRFERFGVTLQTDKEKRRDERREMEDRSAKAEGSWARLARGSEIHQENKNMVSSILDNIVESSMDIGEDKRKKLALAESQERARIKFKKEKQKRKADIQEIETTGQKLEQQQIQEIIEEQKPQVQKDVDELVKIGQTTITPPPPPPPTITEQIGDIQETEEDIQRIGQQLVEALDDEEFEDIPSAPDPSELPIPSFVQNPTPAQPQLASRSNTQGTQTSVNQGISGGLADRARQIKENRKIPLPDRPKTSQFEINKKRQEDERKKLIEEKAKTLAIQETSKLAVDDIFKQGLEKSAEHERKIQLENRKRREAERKQIEIERKQRGEARLKRDRDKAQATSSALSIIEDIGGKVDEQIGEIEDIKQIAKETTQDVIEGALEKDKQREDRERLQTLSELTEGRTAGQGAKAESEEIIRQRWLRANPEKMRIPKEMETLLKNKKRLEDEKRQLLGVLFGMGLNQNYIDFNARIFTKVQSQREDHEQKRLAKELMEQHNRMRERNNQELIFTQSIQEEILFKIEQLLQIKYDLRKEQNKLRKFQP